MKRGAPHHRFAALVDLHHRLSPPARRFLWALIAFETALIATAERDIQRRPANTMRGPKLLWRAIATQNVIGPAAYFLLARKRSR
jgi:hypothetical protein